MAVARKRIERRQFTASASGQVRGARQDAGRRRVADVAITVGS
jgi:hypothetical protein